VVNRIDPQATDANAPRFSRAAAKKLVPGALCPEDSLAYLLLRAAEWLDQESSVPKAYQPNHRPTCLLSAPPMLATC